MFRRFAIASIAVAAIGLTGCASLPSPEAMKAEVAGYKLPKLPEAGQAMVYVVRPSSLGTLIRFNVFLNDKEASSEMGYTRGSQYIYFSVPPGSHQVYSKAENWAEQLVNVKAGDVIFIQQEAQMGVIMARNALMQLDPVTGTYHVKNTTPGTIIKTAK